MVNSQLKIIIKHPRKKLVAKGSDTMKEPKQKISEYDNLPESADFETAILATKFGLFNWMLIVIAFPATLTMQLETSSMSYVFPAAQCDLELTLKDKGLLNAITFAGMIVSGLFVGFIADLFGRRKILCIGYYLDALFVLITAFAPSFYVILVGKFLSGFIITAPGTTLTTYLSEFHGKQYRSRVPLTMGILYSIDAMLMPLIAWTILPLNIHFDIFGGWIEFHAWNAFLLLIALPGLISGTMFTLFMPETPRYLMTKGRQQEALNIFKNIFKFNTFKPQKSYPVTKLKDETNVLKKNRSLKELWEQASSIFRPPSVTRLILVCTIELLMIMSTNTLRLWLPQIFQVINDYEFSNNGTSSFCSMLDTMRPLGDETDISECTVNLNNSSVYINSMIVAASSFCGYVFAALVINSIGKKKILFSASILAGSSMLAIYIAPNKITALVLFCTNIACISVSVDVLIAVIIDLFPTSLRASAVSMALLCGRFGSIFGNIAFPWLVQAGCGPPFFTLGSLMIASALLSLLLPNTDLKNLE